jgi:hypothetical protein
MFKPLNVKENTPKVSLQNFGHVRECCVTVNHNAIPLEGYCISNFSWAIMGF